MMPSGSAPVFVQTFFFFFFFFLEIFFFFIFFCYWGGSRVLRLILTSERVERRLPFSVVLRFWIG